MDCMTKAHPATRAAREPFDELPVPVLFPGQDFERDEAVQARLPGLIDHAHAAAAEAFEDFELGEQRGDFGRRRRRQDDFGSLRAGPARSLRLRGEAGLEHTFRANAAQRRGGHGFPAMRTFFFVSHIFLLSPIQRKNGPKVTGDFQKKP